MYRIIIITLFGGSYEVVTSNECEATIFFAERSQEPITLYAALFFNLTHINGYARYSK